MGIAWHERGMVIALGVSILFVIVLLARRNHAKTSRIQLDDLLIGEDGKVSKAAFVMHGSFFLTSWVVVYQALNHALSETTFGLYIATWVVPTVTKLVKGPSQSATSETIISQTTVTPKEPV